jgi:hypothetical protein
MFLKVAQYLGMYTSKVYIILGVGTSLHVRNVCLSVRKLYQTV